MLDTFVGVELDTVEPVVSLVLTNEGLWLYSNVASKFGRPFGFTTPLSVAWVVVRPVAAEVDASTACVAETSEVVAVEVPHVPLT